MRVALGFRPHSGWAAAVAVGGGPATPTVLDRRRIPLADVDPPVQPYHDAAGLDPSEAAALIDEARATAYAVAEAELARLLARLRADGHEVTRAGIAAGSGSVREDLPLDRVLAAHSALHAAEGELYRDALADAAAKLGLAVSLLPPRDTAATGRRLLGCDEAALRALLTELGRPFGAPWTRDEKDATVVALLALEGTALESLLNIGPRLAADLRTVGVPDAAALRDLGAAAAARRLEEAGLRDCTHARRALEGALRGIRWTTQQS